MKPTPNSEIELYQRAQAMAGETFAELAAQAGIHVPFDLKKDKGWVGQLLEWHLGATAGSKPEQDFAHLGIELKTIPIGFSGKPLETTFICTAPLLNTHTMTWQNSHLRNKLSRILWVPVEGEREIPLSERRVGCPFLWSANAEQEQILQEDWEELMEMIALGQIQRITARIGQALHIRPKAANGRALTDAYGESGRLIKTRPRGFYLRTQFTHQLIQEAMAQPR